MDKFFNVLNVHRDDIRSQGFNPDSLTDDDMERIGRKMGEGMMESGAYWDALEAACADVPKLIK